MATHARPTSLVPSVGIDGLTRAIDIFTDVAVGQPINEARARAAAGT